MEKIVITGCAGFIGMHLCINLLEDGCEILGIDNMNDFYDPKLKSDRLNLLLPYDNFRFINHDIKVRNHLYKIFKSFRPKIVINLAGQAGVRYSLENPRAYVDDNILGFLNILEICKDYKVEKLIYASSSSVYGKNSNLPFSEKSNTDLPISMYAASKKCNELMAHAYHHLYGLNTIGLRFFTVYGPWGRPDMALYIFLEKIIKGEPIPVFNNGHMSRDFTYVEDIVGGVKKCIKKPLPCEIFNLGNNQMENILEMISIIEKSVGKKAKLKFLPLQLGDVTATLADIKYSKKVLNYNPKIGIEEGIPKFVEWYFSYKKHS